MLMMQTELLESGLPVRKISVVWLCRNSQNYLPYLFDTLAKIEKAYRCEFEYFIAENGSTDNTCKLISDFLYSREGKIITFGNTAKLDQLSRIERIASLRNMLLDSIRPLTSDWVLLLDTDIYFEYSVLADLFALSPSDRKIGMLCAYGTESFPDSDGAGWRTQCHYYDTYAFLTDDDRLYWPSCVFEKCEKCSSQIPDVPRIKTAGTVEVHSAFGGLALINSKVLNNAQVRWGTVPLSENTDIKWEGIPQGEMLLCEHIYFCKMLRQTSGLSVAVACDVPVYWDFSSFQP